MEEKKDKREGRMRRRKRRGNERDNEGGGGSVEYWKEELGLCLTLSSKNMIRLSHSSLFSRVFLNSQSS